MIPPGSTIGILGGGQLGRMLGLAAAQLGYRVHVFAPEASGPATEVAAEWTQARFEDTDAMRAFAAKIDVATYVFENVDPHAVSYLSGMVPVHPSPRSLDTSRYRPAEKMMAATLGGRTAEWRPIGSLDDLRAALDAIGTPFDAEDEALVASLVATGHASTPNYSDPAYPITGRQPRTG